MRKIGNELIPYVKHPFVQAALYTPGNTVDIFTRFQLSNGKYFPVDVKALWQKAFSDPKTLFRAASKVPCTSGACVDVLGIDGMPGKFVSNKPMERAYLPIHVLGDKGGISTSKSVVVTETFVRPDSYGEKALYAIAGVLIPDEFKHSVCKYAFKGGTVEYTEGNDFHALAGAECETVIGVPVPLEAIYCARKVVGPSMFGDFLRNRLFLDPDLLEKDMDLKKMYDDFFHEYANFALQVCKIAESHTDPKVIDGKLGTERDNLDVSRAILHVKAWEARNRILGISRQCTFFSGMGEKSECASSPLQAPQSPTGSH